MNNHQAGAVLFTVNLDSTARFYERVASMRVLRSAEDHVVLEIGSFQLTVHQIPERYVEDIVISVPPAVRESGAIKLSFGVDSISRSRQTAAEMGGLVYGPEKEWALEGATVCAGYDPDGNVFQLVQVTGENE